MNDPTLLSKDTLSTPRTDAEESRADEYYEGTRVVTADFARQLERELSEAFKDAERYRWLRHGDNDEAVIRMSGNKRNNYPFLLRNHELDAVIDAKMKEQS
jgi:hypothetical protein